MANLKKAKDMLEKIGKEEGITSVTLVSRSGMYIAGDVPSGAHTETFVAMAAILLGSAETAATEIGEGLDSITVNLHNSRIMIRGVSDKTLVVVCIKNERDMEEVNVALEKHLEGFTDD